MRPLPSLYMQSVEDCSLFVFSLQIWTVLLDGSRWVALLSLLGFLWAPPYYSLAYTHYPLVIGVRTLPPLVLPPFRLVPRLISTLCYR